MAKQLQASLKQVGPTTSRAKVRSHTVLVDRPVDKGGADEGQAQLMDSYLHLATFPDVKPGFEELRKIGMRLGILSNGEPKMLRAAVQSAGLGNLIDIIFSVA